MDPPPPPAPNQPEPPVFEVVVGPENNPLVVVTADGVAVAPVAVVGNVRAIVCQMDEPERVIQLLSVGP